MSQTTPQVADTEVLDRAVDAPRVRVLLTVVADADLAAALAVVGRQVYEPGPEVVVVGDVKGLDLPEGVSVSANLEDAIGSTDSSFDYLWLLHADARPRPDALSALIAESERNDASLAGSKLLKAGTMDELESVGGATDVFGEPYSGLDEGEIDLQQYDVVREVAFVQSASMLVRRDLAQGLKGLDPLLPPVSAGLDFSQRARLAGGKVISVPSSEVYHQTRCGARGSARLEQAGRLRAMVTAYSRLTLLWVLPYDFLVSVLDSLGSLLLFRWRPLVRHVYSWAWNTYHLPSTIRQRSRLKQIRSEGDEELFRFQARGSLRLRSILEELSARALSLFDDDQALARGTKRVWTAPGIWGALIGVALILFAARSILFTGMPNTGFSFPFEPAGVALERWLGGWNASGLGSPTSVHPSVGLTGAASFLWFGLEGASRTLLTVLAGVLGLVGLGRLAGRLGLRGPGRYLAGLVLIAGPGTAALVGRGSWLALAAAAMLPWAVRAAFIHPHHARRGRLGLAGWALLTGILLAALSPLLVVVPLLTVAIWRGLGGDRGSYLLGLVTLLGGIAGAAFLLGDPGWILDPGRRLAVEIGALWPMLVIVATLPLLVVGGRQGRLGLTGGVLALLGVSGALLVPLGPGVEEALLVTGSFGAALVAAAALDSISRSVFAIVAAAGGVGMLVLSMVTMSNGRLGLPAGDVNERLEFAITLADDDGAGRILHASVDRSLIPGEVRAGPGFWYRVLDASGTTHDEVWLPQPRDGDRELADAVVDIASGADLRPGARLASHAIDWVVLEGPAFRLDEVLVAQLDLVPIPLDPSARVYENLDAAPLAAGDGVVWERSGSGFSGEEVDGRIALAVNHDEGWEPESLRDGWHASVSGVAGQASYTPEPLFLGLAIATVVGLLASVAAIVVGRRRR
ncbi:MAG TPA: glycosyltransferase [Acidimicrobiia bacterium]|jgi:GT2 family glycosyltransferase|nr:glycosyltransferase [Acidimicrobiia bacterium]